MTKIGDFNADQICKIKTKINWCLTLAPDSNLTVNQR